MRYDLIIIGHLVLDRITHQGRISGTELGGPCIYAGLAARALGASVLLVSKVGPDFGTRRLSWIRSRGISVEHVKVAKFKTTRFWLDYQDDHRDLTVTSMCETISDRDVSNLPEASAIHLGPVLNEIPLSLAMRVADKGVITSLDPQGYLRTLSRGGKVNTRPWKRSTLLKKLDILKLSEDEFRAIIPGKLSIEKLSDLGPDIILISRGSSGEVVWSRERGTYTVPAYKTRAIDPTGAGDALLGAFLATWLRTDDLLWSAAMGSAVASFVTEKVGPKNFGSRRQIERRAEKILDATGKVRDFHHGIQRPR